MEQLIKTNSDVVSRSACNEESVPNESFVLRNANAYDLDAILKVERETFEYPWARKEFEYCFNEKNCRGILIERNGELVGYLFYEKRQRCYALLNCAIVASQRRRGLGTRLARVLTKLLDARRSEITCFARESNESAFLFLRSLGFREIWRANRFYRATNENAYKMTFQNDTWEIERATYRRLNGK